MQRYNSFNLIHKALRAMLYDAALSVQQTDFTDADEAMITLEKIEAVLYMFEQHAHHEDSFILPAVEIYEPQTTAEFENEHVEDLRLSNRLKNLLNIYHNAYFAEERLNAGSAIAKSFVEFMIFNLTHMAKEEILLNKVLWEHYTDEQIIELNQRLVAAVSKEALDLSSKWMLRGINNADAIQWLKSVQQTAPPFVFAALKELAEKELPSHRFSSIAEAFTEMAA